MSNNLFWSIILNILKVLREILTFNIYIEKANIKVVIKTYLDKDCYGIYRITFYNKGSKDGLINSLSLKIGKKKLLILDERNKSIIFPVRISANKYCTFIIESKDIFKECKENRLHSMLYFFKKKKCYKACLLYSVTSHDQIKNFRYIFYLLDNTGL